MGSMHMRVDIDRLTRVGGPSSSETTTKGFGGDVQMTTLEASQSIDVRGQRVDEALSSVEHFIDDAIAAGLESVEILHGKGTGALREAIHDELRRRSDIASFEKAPIEGGGAGVTYVDLA
jgi:DNA mismatch repair protein MutS2